MKLFDSHCHLDDRVYDKDIDEIIKRTNKASVYAIMIVETDTESSKKALALAESHNGFYASIAIYPHNAKDCS